MARIIEPTSFTSVTLSQGVSMTTVTEVEPPIWTTKQAVIDAHLVVNNGTMWTCDINYNNCEDRYNDGINCGNDSCFLWPYVVGDKIYIQIQFDKINGKMVTDSMRLGTNWKNCNSWLSYVGLSKLSPTSLWNALDLNVYDECSNEEWGEALNCASEVFVGAYIDRDRSRKLGWLGLDSSGLTTDPAKTVWVGYMFLVLDTGAVSLPDQFRIRFKGSIFGLGASVQTDSYRLVKCNEPTFTVSGEHTYKDCFGYFYGLPYYCHYVWFTKTANGCLRTTNVNCQAVTGQISIPVSIPQYSNVARYPGALEAVGYDVTKENFSHVHGATRSRTNTRYKAITKGLPPYVADILANAQNGRKVYVNGSHVLPSGFEKGLDIGKHWWADLEFIDECDSGNFCNDCER